MENSLEARIRSLEKNQKIIQARINALENNKEEFGHDVREFRRQIAKLMNMGGLPAMETTSQEASSQHFPLGLKQQLDEVLEQPEQVNGVAVGLENQERLDKVVESFEEVTKLMEELKGDMMKIKGTQSSDSGKIPSSYPMNTSTAPYPGSSFQTLSIVNPPCQPSSFHLPNTIPFIHQSSNIDQLHQTYPHPPNTHTLPLQSSSLHLPNIPALPYQPNGTVLSYPASSSYHMPTNNLQAQQYQSCGRSNPYMKATPRVLTQCTLSQGKQKKQKGCQKKQQFDPIPCTYTALLPQLLQQGLIERARVTKIYNPPYPSWYNVNDHCDFHHGVAGHSTEGCILLKERVQDLMKEGKLIFEANPKGSNNPLMGHR